MNNIRGQQAINKIGAERRSGETAVVTAESPLRATIGAASADARLFTRPTVLIRNQRPIARRYSGKPR